MRCFVVITKTLWCCSCCFLVISYWQWPLSPQSHLFKRTFIPDWSTVPVGLPCLFNVRGDYRTINVCLFNRFYPTGEHSLSYPDNLLSLRAFGQRSCWKITPVPSHIPVLADSFKELVDLWGSTNAILTFPNCVLIPFFIIVPTSTYIGFFHLLPSRWPLQPFKSLDSC